jgi:hypothetical protein
MNVIEWSIKPFTNYNKFATKKIQCHDEKQRVNEIFNALAN